LSAPAGRGAGPATEAEGIASVDGLTRDGEGVVHAGKTVFIAGALPGERIRFRRTRRHRQHDDGQLLEILAASPQRVTPRCAHFGVCGGCALQHLAPQAQLAAKERELKDNLARIGQVQPMRWLEPLAGPAWGYRRRARLGAKYVHKKGCVVVGFRERAAPYVAQLAACEVLAAPVGALITPLAALLSALDIRAHVPQIEVAVGDNHTALVLRVLQSPSTADLERLSAFAAQHRLVLYLQPGDLGSVRPLSGEAPLLRYDLPQFDISLDFAPTDFIQVNAPMNALLVARAVELLQLTPEAAVLDLFCGIGNFSLALARHAGRCVGIEGEVTLVERARQNAARNALGNSEFHVADLSQPPDLRSGWLRGPYTHVLLDPPRTGARELVPALAALAPRRVLYISCHPGSLARDLGLLVHQHGFTLEAAGVVDMFPHTAHVESLALLVPPGVHGPAAA
jgi:23S rRNA (uracil1939-C5)-methyltransferase